MGKTFVEDERPCDSCVNATRYGCASWNCEYINRDEAIKAWRVGKERVMTEIKLTKRYPHSRTEDITDAFMRGYEIGKEQEHRWWSAFCANCKTENSSEIPNNCEHITEDGVTCAKYPACDDCPDNPLNKVKGSERLVKGSEQTEPTISKMEQVEDEPQTCSVNGRPYDCGKCEYFRCTADEPQTERNDK